MGLFSKGGKASEQLEKEMISVIKYEGANDVFVWRHPSEDFAMGSQLIVHESQEAIFFLDGRALDLFGSGRYTLETQSVPLLNEVYKFPTGGKSMFHSEVYFINLATQMGIKWGTDSKVRLFDPASGLHIEIGASGTFNIRVNNSRKLLLKLVGTESEFTGDELVGEGIKPGKFRALVMNKVKSNLAQVIKEKQINILEVDSYIDELSEGMRLIINETLDDYGLVMPEFYITSISTPDDDPNFRRLKQQFADRTLKIREEEIRKAEAEAQRERRIVQAQTEAQLKMVGAQGEAEALKIKAQAEAEAYKMQAYAEAEEMRAKGFTYQQQTAREVGLQAMQNGLTGSGSGGGIGDIAGLGVTLGAMGGVIGMTREALDPIVKGSADMGTSMGAALQTDGWSCECGKQGITSRFCPECGAKRPEKGWDCECGKKGITSKFCPECGAKRPEESTWDCKCGQRGISSKFCPECGAKRGEEDE